MEIQCYCHANLGRSVELVAEIEAPCSHTQFVSFRHLEEDHEGATMCTKCWPHPRGCYRGYTPEFHRSRNACLYTCSLCRVILPDLVDNPPIDRLLDMGVPRWLVTDLQQTPHQVNPSLDDRSELFNYPAPDGTPEQRPHTDYGLLTVKCPDPLSPQKPINESDPSEPSPMVCAGISSHCRVGLDKCPVRASGLSPGNVEEGKSADLDHVSKSKGGGSSGDV